MVFTVVLLLSYLTLACCRINSPQCDGSSTDSTQSLTLQFTASYPTQIPPISTVYKTIMTKYINAIDCDYIMVENIEDDPVQTGTFTGRTTVDALTVYRAGCMTQTVTVTRRDLQDSDESRHLQSHGQSADLVKRTPLEANTLNTVLSIANRLSAGIDPTNENITVRDFRFLEQLNTALFALNIVDSGIPLDKMCGYMRDPSVGMHLEENLIDSKQAANIVCYAEKNGLFFNESHDQLLSDLAGIEYAIQIHAYGTATLQDQCAGLDLIAASFLGIDAEGVDQFVCNGTAGAAHPSISATATPSNSTITATGVTTSEIGPLASTGWSSSGTAFETESSTVFSTGGPALSTISATAGTLPPPFNISLTTITTTVDVLTITTGETGGTGGISVPSKSPLFYNPPRLIRDRLRRHGRSFW